MPWVRSAPIWVVPAAVLAASIGILAHACSRDDHVAVVPNVVGLQATDADEAVTAAGFEAELSWTDPLTRHTPEGEVVDQVPHPGSEQIAGSPVDIVLSERLPDTMRSAREERSSPTNRRSARTH